MANSKTDLPIIGLDKSKREIQSLSPLGHHERVDGSAASATSSETFYKGQIVRVFPIDNVAYLKFGTGTATTSDIPFSADTPEYINIQGEWSALIESGDLTDGEFYEITAHSIVDFTTRGAVNNKVGTKFVCKAGAAVTLTSSDSVKKLQTSTKLTFIGAIVDLTVML